MDFKQYELLQNLQLQLTRRELCVLLFINRPIRNSSIPFIPTCYCLLIAIFARWKSSTKDAIYNRKYRRSSSWKKRSRNEETELLCF